MKHLSLKDVMRNLSVTINADGLEVSNPAGTAQYDVGGVRTTVNGIPEYFPISIAVGDTRKPEPKKETGLFGGTITGDVKSAKHHVLSVSVKVDSTDLDKLEAQLKRIVDLHSQVVPIGHRYTNEHRMQESIMKAITTALQQGGPIHQGIKR